MVFAELLLAGLVVGFLAGLLGIGGGFIVVPVLFILLPALGVGPEIVPKVAVATSLAAMVPTALSATFAQYRRGALEVNWLWRLVPGAALGAASGSQIAAMLTGPWVAVIFAVYSGYFALKMVRDRPLQPNRPGRIARGFGSVPIPLVAFLIGAFSAIAGVGGASLTVPFLLFRGVEMKRAVAASSAVGLSIALAGSLGFAGTATSAAHSALPALAGLVCWPAALLLAVSAVAMAPRGVAASHSLPVPQLKRVFACVLVVACGATLAKTVASTGLIDYASRAITSRVAIS